MPAYQITYRITYVDTDGSDKERVVAVAPNLTAAVAKVGPHVATKEKDGNPSDTFEIILIEMLEAESI